MVPSSSPELSPTAMATRNASIKSAGDHMSPTLDFGDLVAYTNWQRRSWQSWFKQRSSALSVTTGANGDGRFPTVGGLIRHIFSAEVRYIERIMRLPLTDTSSVPTDDADALFEFGVAGRTRLEQLMDTMAPALWDVPVEFPLLKSIARATPRKIILHVLTHEIRHWAQMATLLRLQSWPCEPQDLLLSPVLGDPIQL
jgi:uncharacterized damage-inducible protein DinB